MPFKLKFRGFCSNSMAKPIIFIVDDEIQVLNAIERDLRNYYGEKYKILKASSGKEAIEALLILKKKSISVALFLVDQRMPEMSGTDFILEASLLFPEAKKVLLTAYSDTEAAIQSINDIGLDYYLLKPWDPPEEKLYPILDDLLSDWEISSTIPYDGIKVIGTLFSPRSHDVKEFLSRNQIPYRWMDIDQDKEAKKIIEEESKTSTELPLVIFPDGSSLSSPKDKDLARKIGFQTKASKPYYDLIIIGGGPSGLGASVYGSSEGLKILMIEKKAIGGQAGTSSWIENYLGFPKGLSGADLSRRAVTQAKKFGTEILLTQEAIRIRQDDLYKYVVLDDETELSSKTVLVATGVTTTKLDKPGVKKLTGKGIYYGTAPTEAKNYKNKTVFVVGGANSAAQGILYLSKFAKKVFMVIRGNSIENGMSQYLADQINATKNISVLLDSEVKSVGGKDKLESVNIINSKNNKTKKYQALAMFIFIGALPHSSIVDEVVELDEKGFIITGLELIQDGSQPKNWPLKRQPFYLETSVPGIFAAGDVRHGSLPRISAAVGQGAIAINLIHQYLKTV